MENPSLEQQIKSDVIKDRSMLKSIEFGKKVQVADTNKVVNLIKAYGNMDLGFGYTQGYNYIVTLLLLFIDDEERAFWCLVTIMSTLNWREFYVEGLPRARKLQDEMPEMLLKQCPRLHEKLDDDDMLMPFCILIVQAYIMCIFTFSVPVEISKKVFELVILEKTGEKTMLRVIFNMLKHTEERAL
jgi:hypothetical protein